MSQTPDFRSVDVLRRHIAHTMDFYHPRAIDSNGGMFHYFRDDGSVYDASHRHLVSSTRFVFNYAMAAREFERPDYLQAARWGLKYLREVHRNGATGGYAWTLRSGQVEDATNHCYGVAFVLLAYSTALKAGIEEARPWIDETWKLLEQRFWEPDANLYRDEASGGWVFSGYRGQNANMHMCEAMLAAFEATGERRYLDRALLLARRMTVEQAGLAGGLVWEHYDSNWKRGLGLQPRQPEAPFSPVGVPAGAPDRMGKAAVGIGASHRRGVAGAQGAPPVRCGGRALVGSGGRWPHVRIRSRWIGV
jgi:mannose/cellobiose epimerase-like protein (N-acyl-D-glucosamine 2-epimerase family)